MANADDLMKDDKTEEYILVTNRYCPLCSACDRSHDVCEYQPFEGLVFTFPGGDISWAMQNLEGRFLSSCPSAFSWIEPLFEARMEQIRKQTRGRKSKR